MLWSTWQPGAAWAELSASAPTAAVATKAADSSAAIFLRGDIHLSIATMCEQPLAAAKVGHARHRGLLRSGPTLTARRPRTAASGRTKPVSYTHLTLPTNREVEIRVVAEA